MLLLVFANTFEYFFIAIEALKVARNPFALDGRRLAALAAFIWIAIKLPQEWWLHVAQLDATSLAKEIVFGASPGAPWKTALANRPLVAVALVVAAILVLAGTWTAASRLLPPRDSPPTTSADAQRRALGRPRSTSGVPPRPLGWAFVEKIVLLSLVTTIFGAILPGERPLLQTVAGVALIVTVSALLSQWLARHDAAPHSSATRFAALATANVAVTLPVGLAVPGTGATTPLAVFLFLIGLLTMIIVQYDRARMAAAGLRSAAAEPDERSRRAARRQGS